MHRDGRPRGPTHCGAGNLSVSDTHDGAHVSASSESESGPSRTVVCRRPTLLGAHVHRDHRQMTFFTNPAVRAFAANLCWYPLCPTPFDTGVGLEVPSLVPAVPIAPAHVRFASSSQYAPSRSPACSGRSTARLWGRITSPRSSYPFTREINSQPFRRHRYSSGPTAGRNRRVQVSAGLGC